MPLPSSPTCGFSPMLACSICFFSFLCSLCCVVVLCSCSLFFILLSASLCPFLYFWCLGFLLCVVFFATSISPVGWVTVFDVGFSSALACSVRFFCFASMLCFCCVLFFLRLRFHRRDGLRFLTLVFLLFFFMLGVGLRYQ